MEIKNYDTNGKSQRFKMRENCAIGANDDPGTSEGYLLDTFVCNDRAWAIVTVNGDDEPILLKAETLLVEQKTYKRLWE